ncbi:hypothetical protein S245_040342, partial [Arachis hypogaea]
FIFGDFEREQQLLSVRPPTPLEQPKPAPVVPPRAASPRAPSPRAPSPRAASLKAPSLHATSPKATSSRVVHHHKEVQANSDQAMVWNQLKARSFQFNEEMMESLFGYNAAQEKSKPGMKKESREQTPQYIQIIEPKKAKNLSILLKALNVTLEEVRDALLE